MESGSRRVASGGQGRARTVFQLLDGHPMTSYIAAFSGVDLWQGQRVAGDHPFQNSRNHQKLLEAKGANTCTERLETKLSAFSEHGVRSSGSDAPNLRAPRRFTFTGGNFLSHGSSGGTRFLRAVQT